MRTANRYKPVTAFYHVIEYYINNEVVKRDTLCEVLKEEIEVYWANQKKFFETADYKFVELENFTLVTKCVKDYDYSVNKIIESIQ